ncbi:hypothetical protein BS47DRAFT_421922 [Hydnum rufescens UP504]|uniref:Mitotic-spindle organizing protein 1 n=1 Tax=Hydnum rufescens UP504 TaxID=1448309 RepID=A0A9P6B5K5_9AGAM|nr:hypothetical protein BS47DRAFT_421922 [Hydnum rufescens UP504]
MAYGSSETSSAQQTLDMVFDLSQVLNTKLSREQLATCVAMIDSGVNPEALAVRVAVRDLKQKSLSDATQPNELQNIPKRTSLRPDDDI